jgi:hypothetical protein
LQWRNKPNRCSNRKPFGWTQRPNFSRFPPRLTIPPQHRPDVRQQRDIIFAEAIPPLSEPAGETVNDLVGIQRPGLNVRPLRNQIEVADRRIDLENVGWPDRRVSGATCAAEKALSPQQGRRVLSAEGLCRSSARPPSSDRAKLDQPFDGTRDLLAHFAVKQLAGRIVMEEHRLVIAFL